MIQAVKTSVAEDLMLKRVETIAPRAALIDAARLMFAKDLQHLVVIDSDRQVVGVVTYGDILQHVSKPIGLQDETRPDRQEAWESEIGLLITRDPITVTADVPLRELAWTLVINRIHCLPVVDERDRLIGAVTLRDVVNRMTVGVPSRSDMGFQFYTPTDKEEGVLMPAYFRRACGSLVIPVKSLEGMDLERQYARLGYDPSNGRVVVKLVAEQGPGDQRWRKEKINRDGVYLVVPANEFVEHFNISPHIRAYDITCCAGDIYLMPRR